MKSLHRGPNLSTCAVLAVATLTLLTPLAAPAATTFGPQQVPAAAPAEGPTELGRAVVEMGAPKPFPDPPVPAAPWTDPSAFEVAGGPFVPRRAIDAGTAAPPPRAQDALPRPAAMPVLRVEGVERAMGLPDVPLPPPPVDPGDLGDLLDPVAGAVGDATYAVCVESPAVALRCSDPVPLGVPVARDVDGAAGDDVSALLAPAVDAVEGGVGYLYSVARVDAAAAALEGHVFAVFQVPTAGLRASVGFDGRGDGSTLARRSALAFTVEELAAAESGDVRFRADLGHDALAPYPSTWALTFSLKDLVVPEGGGAPEERDPLAGSVRMTPVPAALLVEGRVRSVEGLDDLYRVGVDGAEAFAAEVLMTTVDSEANAGTTLRALVEDVPTAAEVTVVLQADGTTTVDYLADAAVDAFAYQQDTFPSLDDVETYESLRVEASSVPLEVHLAATPPLTVDYEASGRMEEATVSLQEVAEGEVERGLTVHATGLPTEAHASGDAAATAGSLAYRAAGLMEGLVVALVDVPAGDTLVSVELRSLPTSIDARWDVDLGEYVVLADGPFDARGLVSLGGVVPAEPFGDHVSIVRREPGLGVGFQVTGLRELEVRPSEGGGLYRAVVEPGGRPFVGRLDLDGIVEGFLQASDLPGSVRLAIEEGNLGFHYEATDPIGVLDAWFRDAASGQVLDLDADGVPERIDATWATQPSLALAYEASAGLPFAHVFYRESWGEATFEAVLEDVPPWMQLEVADDHALFDARAGPEDAPASAGLGSAAVRYASDGAFLEGAPDEDHVWLRQDLFVMPEDDLGGGLGGGLAGAEEPAGGVREEVHFDLDYEGLRHARVDWAGEELHVQVNNTWPREVVLQFETPGVFLAGEVSRLPEWVTVDYAVPDLAYRASEDIASLWLDYQGSALAASVEVDDLPSRVDLTLDMDAQRIAWSASAVVPRLSARTAVLDGDRVWEGSADLEAIPMRWDLDFGGTHPRFRGLTGPLGSAYVTLTNHGSVTTFLADHASFELDERSGDLDASFRVHDLESAEFWRLGSGWLARVETAPPAEDPQDPKEPEQPGDCGPTTGECPVDPALPFFVHVELLERTGDAMFWYPELANVTRVNATLTPLPKSVLVAQDGDDLRYEASAPFGLRLETEVGFLHGLLVAPSPPPVLGVSLRDGYGCKWTGGGNLCGLGIKVYVYVLGAPTTFRSYATDEGPVVTFAGFKPPWFANFLTVDVDVAWVVAEPFAVRALQEGFPVSEFDLRFPGSSIRLGPLEVKKVLGGNATLIDLHYDGSHKLGRLVATFRTADIEGRVELSDLPAEVDVLGFLSKRLGVVELDSSTPIHALSIDAKADDGDALYAGGIALAEVPVHVGLVWGKQVFTHREVTYNLDFGPLHSHISAETAAALPDSMVERTETVRHYDGLYLDYVARDPRLIEVEPPMLAEDDLDVEAYVNGPLWGEEAATFTVELQNLGHRTSFYVTDDQPLTLEAVSEPFTSRIEAHLWTELQFEPVVLSGCEASDGACDFDEAYAVWDGRVQYEAAVDVSELVIEDLSLTLFGLRTLVARLNVSSSFEGAYNSIVIDVDRITATYDFFLNFATCDEGGCETYDRVDEEGVDEPWTLTFHQGGHEMGFAFCFGGELYHTYVETRPRPLFGKKSVGGATFDPDWDPLDPNDGPLILTIDPNDWIRDEVAYLMASEMDPLGGDRDTTAYGCVDFGL